MKYPRVNLLKKSEQRYQGAVSRRFLLVGIVVAPILFITLLSGVKLIQYNNVQSELKSSRERWVELEPRLMLCNEEQRNLAANQRVLGLIAGWQDSKIPYSKLLDEIQESLPATIQLSRLSFSSKSETSIYDTPADFIVDHLLTMRGVVQGDRPEDEIFGLRKDLLKTECMGKTFKSLKLGPIGKRSGKEGQSIREFSLGGSSAEGDGQ